MMIVGNGFDLQVLHHYKQLPTTSYKDFFDFCQIRDISVDNLILQKMGDLQSRGDANWSDLELSIETLTKEHPQAELATICSAAIEVRDAFSHFLNRVVTSDLMTHLSGHAQRGELANKTYSQLLYDIRDAENLKKIPFAGKQTYYEIFNFYVVNFNYTPLLDNYLFLDFEQFDPEPHEHVDRNFEFDYDPHKLITTPGWEPKSSSYIATELVHPHGYMDIPRSMLFGFDDNSPSKPSQELKPLVKPYVAQLNFRYGELFNDTSLFIIFGCSIGATDQWWWKNIAKQVVLGKSSLLIYWWNPDENKKATADDVFEKFRDVSEISDPDHVNKLKEKTIVISYSDSDERTLLNL
ncbi:AbiH family protein [Arcanobacterium ihumii]|uniref:AbiH family protein n=1 Tax=Arcanobacterium ihumii TaxID=2138162 RepID=UPI00135BDC64|nr:AbiH family protein [Arcanobacterium ihumii]